ncbi:MAG: hypothetical protein ABSA18_02255 [Dehalococcoidia bacterium]
MKQLVLTPAAGKRLIGKALSVHPEIKQVLKKGTLVIVAGTTNAYIVEEVLKNIVGKVGFKRSRFFRGITLPPTYVTSDTGRLPDETKFPGDVVIQDGIWLKGKTIFDVLSGLKEGDIILKGANALDLERKRAAVLIGHPQGGTSIAAIQAMIGRRVRLIVPIGLEKRISGDIDALAARLNSPGVKGHRLLPIPGEVFTELDAISLLTGTQAELIAGGGVCGAEGSVWLAIHGTVENEKAAEKILHSIANEPMFSL